MYMYPIWACFSMNSILARICIYFFSVSYTINKKILYKRIYFFPALLHDIIRKKFFTETSLFEFRIIIFKKKKIIIYTHLSYLFIVVSSSSLLLFFQLLDWSPNH